MFYFNYALTIEQPSVFSTKEELDFSLQRQIVFSHSSSFDPTEINIYQYDNSNNPEYYLLKKTAQAISSERKTKSTWYCQFLEKHGIIKHAR